MFFLFFILVILGSTSSFFTDRVYNSSLDWSLARHIHRSPPLVIQTSNLSLIHVLDSDDSLRLVSTDLKTCNLILNLTYPLRYPRRGVSLGNGKLVIWLLNYRYFKSNHEGQWKFVVVDPKNCDYYDFEMSDKEPDLIDIVDVVGYQDSFDVFIMKLSEDEPRKIYVFRYGDHGNLPADFINNVYQGNPIILQQSFSKKMSF